MFENTRIRSNEEFYHELYLKADAKASRIAQKEAKHPSLVLTVYMIEMRKFWKDPEGYVKGE